MRTDDAPLAAAKRSGAVDVATHRLVEPNIARVDVHDDKSSHWVIKAPAGKTVEWDAAVTDEAPGEYFVWAPAEGAEVPNSGRIDFRDASFTTGTAFEANGGRGNP